ncbi:MAG: FAD-dependent oxidoreductase [Peptostreptococcus sp.]|uniref:NAD(P)/FAD-dependent oxidoreductase n=1 Tax=Peptostreptococcus sp. TaxID=1262 RepID=UPI002FC64746
MKRIILAGGGHGHINILKELINNPTVDYEIHLITDFNKQYYSGMLPGFVEGIYKEEEISFDVKNLCEKAGVNYINEKIIKIDSDEKSVSTILMDDYIEIKEKPSSYKEKWYLENKSKINTYEFDFISMNLGSYSKKYFPIDSRNSRYVKPICEIVDFKNLLDTKEHFIDKLTFKEMIIIGSGASAIELAISINIKYPNINVKIISSSKELACRFNKGSKGKLREILKAEDISFQLNEDLIDVDRKNKRIKTDKGSYSYDYLIISSGIEACDIEYKGYETTEDNYILVDDKLCANNFSVCMGDMICLKSNPNIPKVGVFALRQAPILFKNLINMLNNKEPQYKYTPQKKYLQILNCGSQKAIINYGNLSIYGRLAWMLKDHIDKKYMNV